MSKQISRICPHCRYESHTGDTFCGHCGRPLPGSAENDKTISVRRVRIAPRAVFFILVVGALILGILVGKEILAPPSTTGHSPPGGMSTPTLPPTPSPTPVTKTYTLKVEVIKDVPGQDTGILLTAGDRLMIKASGLAEVSPGLGLCSNVSTNPDGVSLVNGIPCRYTQPAGSTFQNVYPHAPEGTLLASIGQVGTTSSSGWFVVGSNYAVTVWVNGELYLICNDTPGYYYDNTGSYQAIITVVHG